MKLLVVKWMKLYNISFIKFLPLIVSLSKHNKTHLKGRRPEIVANKSRTFQSYTRKKNKKGRT